MSELLHSVHALRDVAASTPEPARSWAAALCHFHAPGAGPWPQCAHPLGSRGWAPALLNDVALSPPDTPGAGFAQLVLEAVHLGRELPEDLGDPLKIGFDASLSPDKPWLGLALARCGALEPGHLRLAAETADRPSLVAMIVSLAAARGEGASTASDAVPPLSDPELLRVLDLLGAARSLPASADPDELVAQIARTLEVPAPPPPGTRGSRALRTAAWVEQLLHGDDQALAHALRSGLSGRRDRWVLARILHAAAWLGLGATSAQALADADLVRGPPSAELAWQALERRPELAPRHLMAHVDLVVQALDRPELRGAALMAAAWLPTLAVLQALLETPVPHDPAERSALGWALACMGDPVAAGHLQALAQADPDLDLRLALGVVSGLGLTA